MVLKNHTFEESKGTATIAVDLDTTEDFLDYMTDAYLKVVMKLKEICEN